MNRAAWAEVEALFAAAAERDVSEREKFVRGAASSADVAREVLSLLGAHVRTSVFDPLTARQDAMEQRREALEPGVRIGAWEVIRELGRGGMGAVYLARRADGQFDQTAALKILSAELLGGAGESRFFAERQILAGLAHPTIARLQDGGISADGRPYFVMEYVDGLPIDAHCDERRLDVVARLRLFLTVCRAVEYAHQHLIVHRDLKPSNVLATADGVPKLLDFGIAKLLDERGFPRPAAATQPGTRVLTPDYAAPEQLHGLPITPASDVYQLGVLLHLLLVGCRPIGTKPPQAESVPGLVPAASVVRPSRAALGYEPGEARGRVADATARAGARRTTPERLSRLLRGDLDDIILKAVRPEPDRRYPTAGHLADDLTRHLERRPVRARPDTLAYRSGKFLRRHAVGLTVAGAVFLLLLGFSVGIERQARRTAVERDRAEQVTSFFVRLFQSTDPARARGDTVTVREVLDRGAVRVRAELGAQPAVQATLMEVMGEVYSSLGLLDTAIGLLGEALDVRRRHGGDAGPDLATTVRRLGMFQTRAGRFEVATPLLHEALQRLRRSGRRGTEEYASALTDIGYAWQVQGRLDLAEPTLLEALAEYERQSEPTQGMGAVLNNLGYVQTSLGHLDSAAGFFRRSVAVRRQVAGEDHPALATSLEALGGVLIRSGELAAADSAVSAALAIRRRVLPGGHFEIAGSLSQRGALLRRQGRAVEAEAVLREALAMRTAAFGPDHFIVASSLNDLALALEAQGRDADAKPLFRSALDGYQRHFGLDHVNPSFVELNLARLLLRTGAREEAEARLAHAVPIARAAFPESRPILGDVVSLASLRCGSHPTEILEDLRGAVDALRPAGAAEAPDDYLRALNTMGDCLARYGRLDDARAVLTASLEASSRRGDGDPYRAFARKRLDGLPRPRPR